MSLRDLAKRHLAKTACPTLSQPGHYRGVPAGQNGSSPYSSKGSAVPRSVPGGTANRDAGTVCPAGTMREGGTNGTLGTVGTVGTSGTVGTRNPIYDPVHLQREAYRRNAKAAREGITDRFCGCGHLATFAWPGDDGRDVWMCGECIPTRGRA
jgi:hypothetical protein